MPEKRFYKVRWQAEFEAATPQEAAEMAYKFQQTQNHSATCFTTDDDDGKEVLIDVEYIGERAI